MTTPAESTNEWVRTWQRDVAHQLNTLGNRISSWLILGNAAALVLAFKALLEPGSCARSLVVPSLWFFTTGLGLAFVGALASYLVSLGTLNIFSRLAGLVHQLAVNEYYIDKLEAEGIEVPDNSELRVQMAQEMEKMPALQAKLPKYWAAFWAVALIYLTSAGMFAAGVISPLEMDMSVACTVSSGSLDKPGR